MTTSNHITYEQPFNEHLRACLRLEKLFQRLDYYLNKGAFWDTRIVISSLINILDLLDRPDLKSKVTQEFYRYQASLMRQLSAAESVNNDLNQMLGEIEIALTTLHSITGKIGQDLRNNEFLNTIRLNTMTAGGGYSFDTPAYYHWLYRSIEEKQTAISAWLEPLAKIRQVFNLLLKLVRHHNISTQQSAVAGFYQTSLDTKFSYQLIQVFLPTTVSYYPEMSLGKHRLNIRFYELNTTQRPSQTSEEVLFHINYCFL